MSERKRIERVTVKPRKIDTERPKAPEPREVDTPGIDPAGLARESLSLVSRFKLNFASGKVARFLKGKSKAGEIFHALLDVLPIPNIHEVVKAVVKDHQKAGDVLGGIQLVRETWQRLDTVRTIATIVGAAVLILATRWTGIDLSVLIDVIKQLSAVI